jgi:DNA-binding NarL/FixJ family response regulator
MFFLGISEFAKFLSHRNHPLEDILHHLARVTLRGLECHSLILYELNESNQFITVNMTGINEAGLDEMTSAYNLSDKYPIADCLRFDKIIALTANDPIREEYPLLINFPHLLNGKTLICLPISLSATPIAALAIFCRGNIELSDENMSFLNAISDVFSLAVYSHPSLTGAELENTPIKHVSVAEPEFTERQLVIMKLIYEGRTNHNISEIIGYSESTVRQEIMKIFILTNSNSRSQTAKYFANNLMSEHDQVS